MLERIRRADHVMVVNGRYVDGRQSVNGAQYANAGRPATRNNAELRAGGTLVETKRITADTEILYAHGAQYWRARNDEAKRRARVGSTDGRTGGMIAYTRMDGWHSWRT